MSSLTHALGPTHVLSSAQSARFPVSNDFEMKPPHSTQIVPKDEDNDPLEDAAMDDLFGNDDDLELKDDEDSKPERSIFLGLILSVYSSDSSRFSPKLSYYGYILLI